MKPNLFLLSLCVPALLVSVSASAQDAKKYQLKLDRPSKAGEKSHEVMTGALEKSQRIVQGAKTIKEEASDLKVELSGDQEILEVSEKGNVKKLSFKVEKFTIQDEENPVEEPFKPGTVITGMGNGDGREKFEVDGKEVKGPAAEALSELLSLTGVRKKEVDEDATFETTEPRAPGTEWKLDGQKFLDALPDDNPLSLNADGISGKAKFTGLKTVDGVECAQFQMNIVMKPEAILKMPPGFKLENVNLKVSGEQLVPVDTALPVPSEKMSQQMEFSGTIPSAAGGLKISVFNRTVKERTSKALK